MKKQACAQTGGITFRTILSLLLTSVGLFIALAALGQSPAKRTDAGWPSLSEQLVQEYVGYTVQDGSALEALIRDNQDFPLLREGEKSDRRLPACAEGDPRVDDDAPRPEAWTRRCRAGGV